MAEKVAEKIFTLVIKVNPACSHCFRKIKQILCMLQEREKIQTIEYDEKKNTIKISGPFDAEALKKKLLCMACCCLDIEIIPPKKEEKKPTPPPPPPPPKVVCIFPPWPCPPPPLCPSPCRPPPPPLCHPPCTGFCKVVTRPSCGHCGGAGGCHRCSGGGCKIVCEEDAGSFCPTM